MSYIWKSVLFILSNKLLKYIWNFEDFKRLFYILLLKHQAQALIRTFLKIHLHIKYRMLPSFRHRACGHQEKLVWLVMHKIHRVYWHENQQEQSTWKSTRLRWNVQTLNKLSFSDITTARNLHNMNCMSSYSFLF